MATLNVQTSIIDYLKSTGQASDFATRKQLAVQQNIKDYTGTAAQNTQLLGILRGRTPTTSVTPTPTPTPLPITPPPTGAGPAGTSLAPSLLPKQPTPATLPPAPTAENYQQLVARVAGGGRATPADVTAFSSRASTLFNVTPEGSYVRLADITGMEGTPNLFKKQGKQLVPVIGQAPAGANIYDVPISGSEVNRSGVGSIAPVQFAIREGQTEAQRAQSYQTALTETTTPRIDATTGQPVDPAQPKDSGFKYTKFIVNGQVYYQALPGATNVPSDQTEVSFDQFTSGIQQSVANAPSNLKAGLEQYYAQVRQSTPGAFVQGGQSGYTTSPTGQNIKTSALQEQQANEAAVQAGTMKNIGTAAAPLYVPTGSPAATNPLGVQSAPTAPTSPAGTSITPEQEAYLKQVNPEAYAKFKAQQTAPQQQTTTPYKIISGDTLTKIARQNNTTVEALMAANPQITDRNLIYAGKTLNIPATTTPVAPPVGPTVGPEGPTKEVKGATDTTPPAPTLSPAETEAKTVLQNRAFEDYIKAFSDKLGLTSFKDQVTVATANLEAVRNRLVKKEEDINNNPWISEELRVRKLNNAKTASQQEIENALTTQQLAQKQYDQANENAQLAAKMSIEMQESDRTYDLQVKKFTADLLQEQQGFQAGLATTGLKEDLLRSQIEATKALTTQRLGKTGITGGVGGAEPITITDFTDTAELEDVLKTVKLTTGQKGDIADMFIVQRQINDLNNLAEKYGGFIGAGPGGSINQFLASVTGQTRQGAQDIRNNIGQIKGFIAKMRGGTSFTPNEQRLLDTYTPTIDDSDPVIKSKLNSLTKYVNDKIESTILVAGGSINRSLSGNQPSDPLGLFQ